MKVPKERKNRLDASKDEVQRELHAAAENYCGVLSGHIGGRAENVRDTVRRRVRERISGFRKKADSSPRSE